MFDTYLEEIKTYSGKSEDPMTNFNILSAAPEKELL
jgi:hypothetical protein